MARALVPTFKNDAPLTGLGAIGHTIGATIKFGGKECGRITGKSWTNSKYCVRFMVMDETGGWKWVQLKYRGDSLQETKQWIKDNWVAIYSQSKLHFVEAR